MKPARFFCNLFFLLTLSVLFLLCAGCVSTKPEICPAGTELLLNPVDDPFEGCNRSVHVFNENLNRHLIRPVSQVYNFIIPELARDGIYNVGQNLFYPLRAVNCLLQQKYDGIWLETKRFGINSTVGILGIRDQASRWNIPMQREDFGQTMAYYQIQDGCFLNLPFLGPSNGRDAVGMLLGIPCSIHFWLLQGDASWAFSGIQGFNQAAAHAEPLNRFFSSNYDSYLLSKAFYSLHREVLNQDYQVPDTPGDPDQSLGYLLLRPNDKDFFLKAKHRSVLLPGSQSKMPYTCWPAENSRGIIVILPGLGGHRLSTGVAGLAELLNSANWSVLALSSSMNPDYFLNLPVSAPPGFFAEDVKQLALAIRYTVEDMRQQYKLDGQNCSVLGFSLGALNALFLSRLEAEGKADGLTIERYLAINPPVDVIEALDRIDEYFAIPETWPENEREQHCRELFLKFAASLMDRSEAAQVSGSLPISLEESRFLIGLNMRLNLAEAILASQKQNNQGFMKNDPGAFKKNALWAEALSLSFTDYMNKSVIPYYQDQFPESKHSNPSWLAEQSKLFALEKSLAKNPKVWVFQNKNDFLIREKHLDWLRKTLADRVRLFPQGGHLGNLWHPDYQQLILKTLE